MCENKQKVCGNGFDKVSCVNCESVMSILRMSAVLVITFKQKLFATLRNALSIVKSGLLAFYNVPFI